MKAKLKKDVEFKPVTIEVTFETEREMRDFKSAFNYSPFCDGFESLSLDYMQIYNAVPCERWKNDEWDDFTKRLEEG